MATILAAVLIVSLQHGGIMGLPVRTPPVHTPPALDVYDQRVFDGLCPSVDCMTFDRQLQAMNCPLVHREFVYFDVNEIQCRGCRVCRNPVTIATTSMEPKMESPTTKTPEVDEDSDDSEPRETTMSDLTTQADEQTTTQRTDLSTETDHVIDDVEADSSEDTTEASASQDGTDIAFDPLRNFKVQNFMDRWVDDGGLMAFGDDDAMMSEFLNTDKEDGDDLGFLFDDADDDKYPSHSKSRESTVKNELPSTTTNSHSEEERQRILETCPSYDCAAIEYMMECPDVDRERTFTLIQGVQCEGCRKCRDT